MQILPLAYRIPVTEEWPARPKNKKTGSHAQFGTEFLIMECGTPFTFAVLDLSELVSRILGHFFATLYQLTYPG